jgi:hypothetical protein
MSDTAKKHRLSRALKFMCSLFSSRAELKKYDGFIVTHSPVFVRFFESLGKPVILINSCRYDTPFCWNGDNKVVPPHL